MPPSWDTSGPSSSSSRSRRRKYNRALCRMIRLSPDSQTTTEPPCRLERALVMIRVFAERGIRTDQIDLNRPRLFCEKPFEVRDPVDVVEVRVRGDLQLKPAQAYSGSCFHKNS